MPILNIPNRICPHCGGTEWKVRTWKSVKGPKLSYSCANKVRQHIRNWANKPENKARKKINAKLYHEKNKVKHNKRSKAYYAEVKNTPEFIRKRKAYALKIYHSKKHRKIARAKFLKHWEDLTDQGVRNLIRSNYSHDIPGFRAADIPPELIPIYRNRTLLKRQLKQLQHGKAKNKSSKTKS